MRNYYIFSSGRISRRDNTLYVENENGEKKAIPIEDVESIYIFGELDLNTKLLNFLSQHNKILHVFNYYGFYSGSFIPRDRNVSGTLLIKQVQHYMELEKRMYLAYSFIEGAFYHMIRNLKEYSGTEEFQEKIKEELERANKAKSISELMGCEGRARDAYYQAFNVMLKGDFFIERREKRPPTNPVNALISFANSMIYTTVLSELYHTQLNPTVSYLHEPREQRFSLCLDLAEIFKPLIGDAIIFKLVNNGMIRLEDFEEEVGYCYLTKEGKKKFLKLYDEKINSTIKHRKLKRNVSYKTLIRLECYKLIKRLLEDEPYKPLKAWW